MAAAKQDLNRLLNRRELSSRSSRGSVETAAASPKSAVDFTRPAHLLLMVGQAGPVRPCGMFCRIPPIWAKLHTERPT